MALPASLLKVRFDGDVAKAHDVGRFQDNVGTLLNPIATVPILGANQLTEVALGATAVDVAHGLGRAWTNYLVTSQNANATVWTPSNANPTQFVTLQASGTVTVNLLVW